MKEIKQMLRNYKHNQDKLQKLLIQIEMVEEDRAGRGVGLGEIKSNRDRVSDPTGDIASQIVDKVSELKADTKKIAYEIKEVEYLLKALTPTQKVVISLRYIYHQSWVEVSKVSRLTISETQEEALRGLNILKMVVERVR